MEFTHELTVWFSKSFGLFYLLALSLAVLVYVYWLSNRKQFEQAASSILGEEEDRPWR